MHLAWGMLLLPAALAQLTATDFVPYYNYEGALAVAGTVTVTTDGTSQTLDYALTGTEFDCAGGADSEAANSCGVHIHLGTACDGDAGGHYYDDELVASDPWGSITYVTAAFPPSDTTDSVDTGYTEADLVGRTLIIHDYNGGRIACALLTAPSPAPYALDWEAIYSSGGPNALSLPAGTTVTFSWTGGHNVYEVDATAFDNCDKTGTQLASTSVQTVDVAAPDTPTTRYFVCTVGMHCSISGQKIAITWEAASTAAPVASTDAPTPGPSAAATLAPTNSSNEPTQNIVELAQANDFLSTLIEAVIAADLVDTLSGDGPFTVFAPTNDAFAALPNGTLASLLLPENQPQLIAILTYHVVPGKIMSTELSDGQEAATVQGDVVTITLPPVKVNGATVSTPDIEATNGVVHVIDTVLMPPAPPTPAPVASVQTASPTAMRNIVQLAQATSILSTLVQAVIAADLVDTLSGPGPFTVFAPTDDAFAALGSTVDDLLKPENNDTLVQILTYHVVPGTVLSSDLTDGDVTTVQGSDITVTTDPVTINGANVVQADVMASNGVVHVIDSVLIPPTAPAPAPTSGEFSNPVPTTAPVQMPTAETVVINSQLVLAQVTVDAATLEIVVKNALVETLSYVTSTDQIVAFSVVSSRRRRLQQSTTKVTFSVRVEGSAEMATGYAEAIVTELSDAAANGDLTTQLNIAADAQGVQAPEAPAAGNDYDAIMAATAVDGAPAPTARPTPQPVSTTPAPVRQPTRRPTPQPVRQPTRRPTPRPTPAAAGMEEEDGSEDQGEDESEDKGADSASGGLAVLGIALAAFIGLLCVGGYVRMKMFGSQDRSDRDWARDLHGSGVSNPAAARDPWGRPTPSETRGVEMASSHGLRSYH